MRPATPPVLTWEVTDHACSVCYGRVLRRVDADGKVIVRCSNCGVAAEGNVKEICWCGYRMPVGKKVQRFMCQPNENPTASFPAEVEVVEVK